jgi:hypothetical protein
MVLLGKIIGLQLRPTGPVMIFGFNTDIRHSGTVYHVQSEARQNEELLQTQVFVGGRCLGKLANSYSARMSDPSFSDDAMHDMLKEQHRQVLDAIRSGRIEEVLAELSLPETSSGSVSIEWVNADSIYRDEHVIMRFQVTEAGIPVHGARLITRVNLPELAPVYSQATTDDRGIAELRTSLDESNMAEAAVLVQVTAQDKSATRKFKLTRG